MAISSKKKKEKMDEEIASNRERDLAGDWWFGRFKEKERDVKRLGIGQLL